MTPAAAADPAAREFLRNADPVLARVIDAHPDFRPRVDRRAPRADAFGTLIFQMAGKTQWMIGCERERVGGVAGDFKACRSAAQMSAFCAGSDSGDDRRLAAPNGGSASASQEQDLSRKVTLSLGGHASGALPTRHGRERVSPADRSTQIRGSAQVDADAGR